MWSFYWQRVIFFILHYFSSWAILMCLIAAGISWRLSTIFSTQDSAAEARLAWWTAALWSGTAISFLMIGFIFG
jgi:hypothetical protein